MRGCPEAGDGIAQTGSLGKLLRPTDGGGRGILDEAWPLLYRAAPHHGGPSPRGLPARLARAPAVDEGAGISRMGQEGAHRLCGGLAPSHVVGAYAVAVAPGQEALLLLAITHDLEGGAALLQLAAHEPDDMLHLLVRIFDDAFIRESYQSRGQTLHILTPLDFTEAACM